MTTKITLSPITRINGFWRIDITIDNGQIIEAHSCGSFFRGLEIILKNRDPRDSVYLTQRICGICSAVHGLAAALAVEAAYGLVPPRNAVLLRNLLIGADLLQNHLRHFFLFVLPDYIQGPDTPPFTPHYQGDFRLSKEENDRFFQHYLDAFNITRLCHEMVVVFGGKIPHNHGIVVGGATVHPNIDRLRVFKSMLDQAQSFVNEAMLPDVMRLSEVYADYWHIGVGYPDFLSYGMFPNPDQPKSFYLSPGVVIDNQQFNLDPEQIAEEIRYSWFKGAEQAKPREEETEPAWGKDEAYSWIKAPRYNGRPLQTGPVGRMWLNGEHRQGFSTMDRLVARTKEARLVARMMQDWLAQLEPGQPIYTSHKPPAAAEGTGLIEAYRGGLGHWLKIEGGRVSAYQIITPSAWNISPRDAKGQPGPVEAALVGTPVKDIDNPVEIGRVVRSFDPCTACATHLIAAGRPVREYLI